MHAARFIPPLRHIFRPATRHSVRRVQKQLFHCQSLADESEVICDKHTIHVGDVIRASAGPTYRGAVLYARGIFRVEAIVIAPSNKKRKKTSGRVWLDCTRLEKVTDPVRGTRGARPETQVCFSSNGRFVLYVLGKPYTRSAFPGVIWRPFKIRKMRGTGEQEPGTVKRRASGSIVAGPDSPPEAP